MKLVQEQLEEVFKRLFQGENIPPAEYRVYVNPAGYGGRYYVQVVWDGFDPMSVTSRQKWIWDRLRKVVSEDLRQHLSLVLARSAKEFVVADELAYRADDRY
mgnify:CR=1 FL=1